MARTKLNLNRFRKIYPQLRKSPVFWYKEQDGILLETTRGECTGGQFSYQTTQTFNSPVVVATAYGTESNVNVWVASVTAVGDGTFAITVQTSDSGYTGYVDLHIGESNA